MTFTPDQVELARYVRQWLDEKAPFDEVRRTMETDSGFDPAQWTELGGLGWLGMAIREEHGGAGYGFMEQALLGEEMGRTLYPSPFLATVIMGGSLVSNLGSEDQKAEILAEVASGERTLAVAFAEPGRGWATDGFATTAEPAGDGWVVSGAKRFVVGGYTADTLIVGATTGSGTGLFLVEGNAEGVTRTRLDVMDLTRPQAHVDLASATATRLGSGEADASPALVSMLDRAVAFLAMEQVGGAQACLDMSVAYAKQRHQFGRAIGSFQAIKHMCADMLVAVESAKSAAYHLAWAMDNDPAEVATAARLAKSYCSDAYFRCAADTIQIHGGIGFTWEHNAHLYFKRAKSAMLMFGDSAEHRERLADLLGV